jgi:hypothetical protein
MHPTIKKLNVKNQGNPFLILNSPNEYKEVVESFEAEVHTKPTETYYPFVQVFGTSNEKLKEDAKKGAELLEADGLLWLCYPKKSSKTYKGSDCSRESVASLLSEEGFEPVRQVAIDEDWSALRFRKPEHIKTMARKSAVTEQGKERIKKSDGLN